MTYFEKIVDVNTGEETLREYTAQEIATVETAKVTAQLKESNLQQKATEKAALLTRLDLTAEEATLLLS